MSDSQPAKEMMAGDRCLMLCISAAPLWLKQAAGDPEFPGSLERFTTAMVERLSHAGESLVALQ